MSENAEQTEEQIVEQLYAFVASEMKAGADKATITAKLIDQGAERHAAEQSVSTIYRQIAESVRAEQYTQSALIPGIFGGVLAALVGGAVWTGILVTTEYELGIVAWGIGALCGYAVVHFAGGRKGIPLQLVAVLSGVLGVLAGKYLSFFYVMKQIFEEEAGDGAVVPLSAVFSPDVVQLFVDNVGSMLGGYDILWVGLAVFTAWSIPKGSGIHLPEEPAIGIG